MTRLVVPVVAVGFLAAGCNITGSTKQTPAPKPLSHAQLGRRANRACAHSIHGFRGIPRIHRGQTLQAVVRIEGAFVRVQERMLFVLRGLKPSRRDADTFRSLIGTLDREDLTINHFLAGLEGLQRRRLKALLRRLDRQTKRAAFFAGLIGLHTCAKEQRR